MSLHHQRILAAFDNGDQALTLNEITKRCGYEFPPGMATMMRLEGDGFLERVPTPMSNQTGRLVDCAWRRKTL